jgi:hypothetical protein
LLGDPFHVPLRDIEQLDRWQVIGLYLAPRDKLGCVIGTAQGPVALSGRDAFNHYWRTLNIPQYRIDQLWDMQQVQLKATQTRARARQREIAQKRSEQRAKERKDRRNG